MQDLDSAKKAAASEAAKLIYNGMTVGLGTGSTAKFFIEALAKKCKEGLEVSAVATSFQSEQLARNLGIHIVDINSLDHLDITVDGADEIDSQLRMIKGGGGALLREKIVASMSKEDIVIVDSSKLVSHLGKFPLPLEVIPFACKSTLHRVQKKGFNGRFRLRNDKDFYVTDNGNCIIDVELHYPCLNPEEVNRELKDIPGILETGLFLNIATKAIIGYPNSDVKIFNAKQG